MRKHKGINARAWFYSTGFNYSAQTMQTFQELSESLKKLENENSTVSTKSAVDTLRTEA